MTKKQIPQKLYTLFTSTVVWMYCSQKTIFILRLIVSHIYWYNYHGLTLWWLRKNKIYIWNELHSIVVVKYKHSSISGRSPISGNELYHSVRHSSGLIFARTFETVEILSNNRNCRALFKHKYGKIKCI